MLVLKRFEEGSIYIMDKDESNNTPIVRFKVKFIDPDKEYAELIVTSGTTGRKITLFDEVVIADDLSLLFKGITIFNGKLSVAIGVCTESYRVIRGELFNTKNKHKRTGHQRR